MRQIEAGSAWLESRPEAITKNRSQVVFRVAPSGKKLELSRCSSRPLTAERDTWEVIGDLPDNTVCTVRWSPLTGKATYEITVA